eukprot:3487424-Prymnesium_polylepis.1
MGRQWVRKAWAGTEGGEETTSIRDKERSVQFPWLGEATDLRRYGGADFLNTIEIPATHKATSRRSWDVRLVRRTDRRCASGGRALGGGCRGVGEGEGWGAARGREGVNRPYKKVGGRWRCAHCRERREPADLSREPCHEEAGAVKRLAWQTDCNPPTLVGWAATPRPKRWVRRAWARKRGWDACGASTERRREPSMGYEGGRRWRSAQSVQLCKLANRSRDVLRPNRLSEIPATQCELAPLRRLGEAGAAHRPPLAGQPSGGGCGGRGRRKRG